MISLFGCANIGDNRICLVVRVGKASGVNDKTTVKSTPI